MAAAEALVARPIAHRGLHDPGRGVIENTLAAARAALARGCAIECDVQRSADGEAVVFHDDTLDRLTTGRGRVDALDLKTLAALPMRGGDERIPTLRDLTEVVDGRVPLIVEVKSGFDGDVRLLSRTLEVLAAYRGPVGVKSFDPRIVAEARRLAPTLPRGIVAMNEYGWADHAAMPAAEKHALANLLHFGDTRPDFISWRVRDLPSAAPFLCRTGLGLPVMAWTVRTPDDRARASANADAMIFEGFLP